MRLEQIRTAGLRLSALVVILGSSGPAHATTVIALPVAAQASIPDVVVEGWVQSRRLEVDPASRRVFRVPTVAVDRALRGGQGARVVEIWQMGDGERSRVVGDPVLAVGERVVAFSRGSLVAPHAEILARISALGASAPQGVVRDRRSLWARRSCNRPRVDQCRRATTFGTSRAR